MRDESPWVAPNKNHERLGELWCSDVAGVTWQAGGPAAIMGFAHGFALAEARFKAQRDDARAEAVELRAKVFDIDERQRVMAWPFTWEDEDESADTGQGDPE